MGDRPNILCIVSEDCPPRLGAYGDTLAHTPNLDRLASDGVVYETANCTSPVCAPSRFAILTGRYAESCPRAQHMQALAHLPNEFLTYPAEMRKAGYYCTNNAKTHYNCDVDPAEIWDESSRSAHWRNRPDDKPFLAVFNCMTTHESCTFKEQPGTVRPEDVTLPSYLPDTPGMRQSLARQYNAIARMDAELGQHLADLEADGLADDTIVFYFSDHGSALPRSKRYLYDEGLRVPLIIRVPPRWRHLMPHVAGTHVSAPVSLVDLFPSFLVIAGLDSPQGLHGTPLLGPQAVPRQYVFGGRDRMGERYDLSRTVRSEQYRYIRNYMPHRMLGQYVAFEWLGVHYQDYEAVHLGGMLNPAQEQFWRQKPAEEFYDLQCDPDATVNLIDDAAYENLIDEHRAALDEHMLAIRDTGFIPEHSPVETWEASRNETLYPLPEIMDLALAAAARNGKNAPTLLSRLSHPSPVMRHWAAKGLLMLSSSGQSLSEGLAAAYAKEPAPQVRIPLAEALGHAGDARHWVSEITRILRTEPDPRIKLQALDALTWLPPFPDISLADVRALHDDEDTYLRQSSDYLAQRLDGTYRPTNTIFDWSKLDAEGQMGKQKAGTTRQ
ncbi:sulfatase-like hydrolase/transferase [Neorhizobium sp. Rsf11]|uniref:Sulfatase-like hydrolase/transferase n=1 Tax=Neorhizobium phenanthreniclasticum TaxID=3157917 RepID=A0ABV0MBA1_9HYPH